MTILERIAMAAVLDEVAEERRRQHAKWGEQNLRDFFMPGWVTLADRQFLKTARMRAEHATHQGTLSYEDILREEVGEVLTERDPAKLRVELIQLAAVCVQWCEKLDREARR